MSAAAAPLALVRAWWRLDRGTLVQTVGLLIAVLSWVWLWPDLVRVGGARLVLANLLLHGYVLSWMLAVTVVVRTIGSREVLVAFLMGTFVVPVLVFVPGAPALARLGSDSDVIAVYWAPVLEESALLLVVGLLVWRLLRRAGRAPGLSDLVVLGFAVGAGYAIHEDALYGRLGASWPDTTIAAAFQKSYGWLFPTFMEPNFFHRGEAHGVFTYQAGHGVFLALALGIVVLLVARHRKIVWLLPAVLLYAMVEHGLANLQLTVGPVLARHLFLNGHVIALVVLFAVPIAVLVDLQRRRRTTIDLPPLGLQAIRDVWRFADGPLDATVRSLAVARYHRSRNAVINGTWRDPGAPAPDVRGVDAWGRIAFGGLVFADPGSPDDTSEQDDTSGGGDRA